MIDTSILLLQQSTQPLPLLSYPPLELSFHLDCSSCLDHGAYEVSLDSLESKQTNTRSNEQIDLARRSRTRRGRARQG